MLPYAGARYSAGVETMRPSSPALLPDRQRHGPAESGQAVVEAAIVMPAMVFLVLVLLQLTMVQHARIMTDYAAYCAARAGIVFNADRGAMERAATIALLPTLGRTDTIAEFTKTYAKVVGAGGSMGSPELIQRKPYGLPIVRVTTLSPRAADFTTQLAGHTGGAEIDFDDVRAIAARPNQLQIELKYFYRMSIPFANSMLQSIYFASRARFVLNQWKGFDLTRPEIAGRAAQEAATLQYAGSGEADAAGIVAARAAAIAARGSRGARIVGGYYFPLKATYTMRMQSNAFRKNAN
jgi:hypothetical protein